MADKSAPAAKINGFPVTAIATASDFCASSIAFESDANEAAPNVFGRLWSAPLSSVIKAKFPVCPNGDNETICKIAFVTTSSGAPANTSDIIYHHCN